MTKRDQIEYNFSKRYTNDYMKALVINVDTATERMAFQKQQLESLEIEFERLSAYQINSAEDNTYQTYYDTWHRPMSISEVSCFFSHKTAWNKIINENQAMLILEDDALLAQNIPCILEELSSLENIDYVNLEERKNRKKLLAKTTETHFCDASLIELYQGRSGAAGYVLWPNGAKKLLKQMNNNCIGIADKFINENYSLQAYQIEPASIIQLDQCQFHGIKSPFEVRTSISSTPDSPVATKQWHFRLRRMLGEIKIGLNQMRHLHHATRRTIKISEHFKM